LTTPSSNSSMAEKAMGYAFSGPEPASEFLWAHVCLTPTAAQEQTFSDRLRTHAPHQSDPFSIMWLARPSTIAGISRATTKQRPT
jgi:hypothetical protein